MRRVAVRVGIAAAAMALLWCYTPPAEPRFRLCPYFWMTGLPCPLCGMTRALFALAKGHLHQALAFNALSPLGAAMLISLFWKSPRRARFWTAGLAAFALYGVVRIFVRGV